MQPFPFLFHSHLKPMHFSQICNSIDIQRVFLQSYVLQGYSFKYFFLSFMDWMGKINTLTYEGICARMHAHTYVQDFGNY